MKTLLLTIGENDYDAIVFQGNSIISAEELANNMYLDDNYSLNHLVIDEDENRIYMPVTLEVIGGHIPEDFVKYVREEIQDHDVAKSVEFYLFEIEKGGE